MTAKGTRNKSVEPDVDAFLDSTPFTGADPYLKLWASAFVRAIRDYAEARASGKDSAPIVVWLESRLDEPGSFIWMCDLFDYDPDRWRDKVRSSWSRLLESGQGRKKKQ